MSDEQAGASVAKRTRSSDELEQTTGEVVKHFCTRYQSEEVELNYNWIVQKFSLHSEERGQEFCSPEFSAGNDSNRWRLKLYPKGSFISQQGHVAVTLTRVATIKKIQPVVA